MLCDLLEVVPHLELGEYVAERAERAFEMLLRTLLDAFHSCTQPNVARCIATALAHMLAPLIDDTCGTVGKMAGTSGPGGHGGQGGQGGQGGHGGLLGKVAARRVSASQESARSEDTVDSVEMHTGVRQLAEKCRLHLVTLFDTCAKKHMILLQQYITFQVCHSLALSLFGCLLILWQ